MRPANIQDQYLESNTLLGNQELEKLTLLRMNREFMKYMRTHYGHLSQQQFNATMALPRSFT